MLYTIHLLINVRTWCWLWCLAYAQDGVDFALYLLVFLARQAIRGECQCCLIYPHTAARRLKEIVPAKVRLGIGWGSHW
jgi:hypothetical protein